VGILEFAHIVQSPSNRFPALLIAEGPALTETCAVPLIGPTLILDPQTPP